MYFSSSCYDNKVSFVNILFWNCWQLLLNANFNSEEYHFVLLPDWPIHYGSTYKDKHASVVSDVDVEIMEKSIYS